MQNAVVVPRNDLRQAPNSESGRGKRPEVPGKRLGAPRNVHAGGHCEQGACELDGIGVKLFAAQTRAKSQDCGVKEEDRTGEDYEDTGPPPVCIRLLQVPGLSKTAKYRVFPYDAGWSASGQEDAGRRLSRVLCEARSKVRRKIGDKRSRKFPLKRLQAMRHQTKRIGGSIMSEQFKARLDYTKYAHEPLRSLYAIERSLHESGIDIKLLHMLKLRASQINGCAYCVDMHWKDARAAGETEQRLYGLNAWRESPYYSEKERAALEWAESVTLVSETHVPDEVYERVRAPYSEKEIVDLTLAVGMINLWNRVAISLRAVPGL